MGEITEFQTNPKPSTKSNGRERMEFGQLLYGNQNWFISFTDLYKLVSKDFKNLRVWHNSIQQSKWLIGIVCSSSRVKLGRTWLARSEKNKIHLPRSLSFQKKKSMIVISQPIGHPAPHLLGNGTLWCRLHHLTRWMMRLELEWRALTNSFLQSGVSQCPKSQPFDTLAKGAKAFLRSDFLRENWTEAKSRTILWNVL